MFPVGTHVVNPGLSMFAPIQPAIPTRTMYNPHTPTYNHHPTMTPMNSYATPAPPTVSINPPTNTRVPVSTRKPEVRARVPEPRIPEPRPEPVVERKATPPPPSPKIVESTLKVTTESPETRRVMDTPPRRVIPERTRESIPPMELTEPATFARKESLDDPSFLFESPTMKAVGMTTDCDDSEKSTRASTFSGSSTPHLRKKDYPLYVSKRQTFVRSGKAKSSQLLNVCNSGTIFEVSEVCLVSGVNRAFIVSPMRGWVSLETKFGPLLDRLTKNDLRPCLRLKNIPKNTDLFEMR
eukprot:UN34129